MGISGTKQKYNMILFKKYAPLLTWFSQTQLGRDYLGISNDYKDIRLLVPNGYHRFDGGKQIKATFFTRNYYEEKLLPSLQRIDELLQYIQHFEDLKTALVGNLGLSRYPEFLPRIYLATTTFTSTAGGDGNIYNDNGGSYATVRALTTGTAQPSTDPVNLYASLLSSFSISRGFTPFDTSSLGAGATISSADHIFTVSSVVAGTPTIHSAQSNQASGTSLAAGDYDNFTGLPGGVITSGGSASASSTGQKTITLNATGRGWISLTGYSMFGLVEQGDQQNSDPGSVDNRCSINMAENATPANRPQLTVTYTSLEGGTIMSQEI
jgi:hypothetical protein